MTCSCVVSTGPDKYRSEAGTSRTASEWRDSRHDKKNARAEYKRLHGREAPSRQDQFDKAMAAFCDPYSKDLKATGYQRDLFTWMLDCEFFTQYAKKEIDFELADFEYMVHQLSLIH